MALIKLVTINFIKHTINGRPGYQVAPFAANTISHYE